MRRGIRIKQVSNHAPATTCPNCAAFSIRLTTQHGCPGPKALFRFRQPAGRHRSHNVTPRAIFNTRRLVAIAAGAFCFAAFYHLFAWSILSRLSPKLVTVFLWCTFVVPGFAVGFIARTSAIVNGLILGTLLVLILAGLSPPHPSPSRPLASWLLAAIPFAAAAMLLCLLGAILGRYAARKIRGA